MNIVILHQYFNTPQAGGPLRSYYLAHALLKHGHTVSVVTTTQSQKYHREVFEGIDVHYLPVPYDNKYGFYDRGIAFARYARGAYKIASSLTGINLCYAISVPITVGIPAMWLKKSRKIPFIFEVGDLWPDAPIELGFVKNPALKSFLLWLEKKIYREADSIVALSEPIKVSISQKVTGKRVDVIPNISDTEYFHPTTTAVAFSESQPFVISYIGAVGFANGLDHVLECARACQTASLPVKFVICGAGALTETLKGIKSRLGIQNLSFRDFQSRDGVRELMDESQAVFVSYRPFPILETGSPNKYFDGLASGKLIIVNFGGWIRDEVESNSCGVYVSPQRPREIVEILTRFLEDDNLLQSYQSNARNLAIKKYSRDILGRRFASVFSKR